MPYLTIPYLDDRKDLNDTNDVKKIAVGLASLFCWCP